MIVGFLTTFFFERRALTESRAEAEKLKKELEQLKLGILTIGGGSAVKPRPEDPNASPDELLEWLRAHQDATGKVGLNHLTTHFITEWSQANLDQALRRLTTEGAITMEDEWVHIR
ncbi:hypothetical protein [Streptomyces sp. NPDC057690]|uniref:hypothetical protein n=1 Tax=Streptomyces sp. NPDC057690 TaxID=3346214 RepID=UPI003689B0E9